MTNEEAKRFADGMRAQGTTLVACTTKVCSAVADGLQELKSVVVRQQLIQATDFLRGSHDTCAEGLRWALNEFGAETPEPQTPDQQAERIIKETQVVIEHFGDGLEARAEVIARLINGSPNQRIVSPEIRQRMIESVRELGAVLRHSADAEEAAFTQEDD